MQAFCRRLLPPEGMPADRPASGLSDNGHGQEVFQPPLPRVGAFRGRHAAPVSSQTVVTLDVLEKSIVTCAKRYAAIDSSMSRSAASGAAASGGYTAAMATRA